MIKRRVDTSSPFAAVSSPLRTGTLRGTAIPGTGMIVCPLVTGSIAVLRVAPADGGADIGVGAEHPGSSNVWPELALVQWE